MAIVCRASCKTAVAYILSDRTANFGKRNRAIIQIVLSSFHGALRSKIAIHFL